MLVCGVDEAGRGPVVGPMVMACIVVDAKTAKKLAMLGVRDSKELSRVARARLFRIICTLAKELRVKVIEPWEIDKAVERKTFNGLNDLEAYVTSSLILSLEQKPDVLYLDAPDVAPEKYYSRLAKYLPASLLSSIKIICEHRADRKYTVVSAASIVAKHWRDEIIRKLEEIYGEIGSGYPTDPRTRSFVMRALKTHWGEHLIRKTWKTVRDLL